MRVWQKLTMQSAHFNQSKSFNGTSWTQRRAYKRKRGECWDLRHFCKQQPGQYCTLRMKLACCSFGSTRVPNRRERFSRAKPRGRPPVREVPTTSQALNGKRFSTISK